MRDFFIRGILPQFHYRFFLTSTVHAVRQIWTRHEMATGPAILTGEAAVAAFLLAGRGTKSVDQTVGLHFECDGPVRRIMAFGRNDGGIRGYTAEPKANWEGSLIDGKGIGMLTVNRFQDYSRKIYSSSVEFRHQSISKNIEEFMGRSEQIQVFMDLGPFTESISDREAADSSEIGETMTMGIYGLMFEAMPGAGVAETDGLLEWMERQRLSARLGSGDIVEPLPDVEVLFRGKMHFFCDCGREKVQRMIRSMGEEEARSILAEQGRIEITCEFCREKYHFEEKDLGSIFY